MDIAAFRFGEYCLIPARKELWRAGELMSVQPRVLDTLIFLVEQRERAVSRDELLGAVWGRLSVADSVVSEIISRTRQVIGDNGEAQHSVRTVKRFGYRWVRETTTALIAECGQAGGVADPVASTGRTAPAPMAPSPPIRRAGSWLRAAALASIAVLGFLIWTVGDQWVSLMGAAGTEERPLAGSTSRNGSVLERLRTSVATDELGAARELLSGLSDHERLVPEVRHEEALLAFKEGRFDDARNAFSALASDLDADAHRRLLLGRAVHGIARAEFGLGNLDVAQGHYDRAIGVLSARSDPDFGAALGNAWLGLGGLHTVRREYGPAEHAYAQARRPLIAAGDQRGLAWLENNIGLMLTYQNRFDKAVHRFELAVDLSLEAGNADAELGALTNLVNAQLALLRPAEALALEPRLMQLRERMGNPVRTAHVDLSRAGILIANGHLEAAEVVLRAGASRPAPSDPALMVVRKFVAADLAFERALWEEASELIGAGLASERFTPGPGMMAHAHWRLLNARRALGDVDAVTRIAAAVTEQSQAFPGIAGVALTAALARAEAAVSQGDAAGARAEFELAMKVAAEKSLPRHVVQVTSAYVRYLLRRGETDEALSLVDRIEAWADREYNASLIRLQVYHATGNPAWRSALGDTLRLAGERAVPAEFTVAPMPVRTNRSESFAASYVP